MWPRIIVSSLGKFPWPQLLSASLVGWTLLCFLDWRASPGSLCLAPGGKRFLLASDFPMWFAEWSLMLLAMMPPALAQPVRRLWCGNLAARRWPAILLFLTGYIAVWVVAGLALTGITELLKNWFGPSAFLLSLAFAAFWQAAPARLFCLARSHRATLFRVFGLGAFADWLRYGLSFGVWCAGACWPLMLVPMLAPGGQLPVMAAAMTTILFDRFARPLLTQLQPMSVRGMGQFHKDGGAK